eukprot:365353-Chlamydomonas_euryale.AAC.21
MSAFARNLHARQRHDACALPCNAARRRCRAAWGRRVQPGTTAHSWHRTLLPLPGALAVAATHTCGAGRRTRSFHLPAAAAIGDRVEDGTHGAFPPGGVCRRAGGSLDAGFPPDGIGRRAGGSIDAGFPPEGVGRWTGGGMDAGFPPEGVGRRASGGLDAGGCAACEVEAYARAVVPSVHEVGEEVDERTRLGRRLRPDRRHEPPRPQRAHAPAQFRPRRVLRVGRRQQRHRALLPKLGPATAAERPPGRPNAHHRLPTPGRNGGGRSSVLVLLASVAVVAVVAAAGRAGAQACAQAQAMSTVGAAAVSSVASVVYIVQAATGASSVVDAAAACL